MLIKEEGVVPAKKARRGEWALAVTRRIWNGIRFIGPEVEHLAE